MRRLQKLLARNGLPVGKADGVFGDQTMTAVQTFQSTHGLNPDGVVGKQTWTALSAGSAGPVAAGGAAATKSAVSKESSWTDMVASWSDMLPAWMRPSAQSGPAATSDELTTLMAKPRLSTDEITRARELIAAVSDESKRGDLFATLQSKTEYHSQRDNASVSGGKKIGDVMCNLTSLAMCLSYLGIANPKPEMQFEDVLEEIRVAKKLPARTMSTGWGGVAKTFGVEVDFIAGNPVTEGKQWYVDNVRSRLRAGDAVMASISGHIVRFQAVTDTGLVADDPYGKSKLLAGESRGWEKSNKKDDSGAAGSAGEDIVWPWSAVETHTMRWIAALRK